MEKNLTITVISKACGIPAPTLRIWEKRYHLFSPERSTTGQRLYSENDLQRLKMIAALLDRGHTISNIAKLSMKELKDLLESNGGDVEYLKSKTETKKIIHLLLSYDLDGLISEMQFQRLNVGAKEFIFKIVLPVLQEIGLMVAKNKYTVTQEHIISSIIRDQLSKITLPNDGEKLERFVLATPEGNLHELSILIADVICRINKVPTFYLGAAHPADCLGEAVSALGAKTIVLGVLSSDQWNYQNNISQYLTKLDNTLSTKVKLILGGGEKLKFPQFKNIVDIKFIDNFEEFDKFLSKVTYL